MCGKSNKIPVVWGLDEKYVLQAFVVMHSILLHSEETFLFVLITADNIAEQVEEMREQLARHYATFEIEVIQLPADAFADAGIYTPYLSRAAYFRLMIPKTLQEYKKCIYLDCDTIVNGNLKELYNISIDDCYIAGVKDCHIIENNVKEYQHQKILGIPSMLNYINSGVMLMNLEKLRTDNMIEKFVAQAKKENWNEDQDVLNVCCYGAIKVLPLKYNLFHFYLGGRIKELFGLAYNEEDFAFDWKRPYILHTGGEYKAWTDERFEGAKMWWRLAEIFADTEAYRKQRRMCNKTMSGVYDFAYIMKQCSYAKAVVIWGYTKSARELYDALTAHGIAHIAAFADNNDLLWGEQYKGIPVMSLEQAKALSRNVTWIIVSVKAVKEIRKQLITSGEKEEQIFLFRVRKPKHYYLALSEEYYDRELEDICHREYLDKSGCLAERKAFVHEVIDNPAVHWREYQYLFYKYRFDLWLKADVMR